MKVRIALAVLAVSMAGCASQPLHSKTASALTPRADEHATSAATPSMVRVTLPYTFTRHGVEIRVNSVEFADSQILVNITLQEMRDVATDLLTSTLMQAVNSAGQALAYSQYTRGDQVQKDPVIHIAAREQFSPTLVYQSAAGGQDALGSTLELRFPTGKYWSSQTAE